MAFGGGGCLGRGRAVGVPGVATRWLELFLVRPEIFLTGVAQTARRAACRLFSRRVLVKTARRNPATKLGVACPQETECLWLVILIDLFFRKIVPMAGLEPTIRFLENGF